MQIWFKYYYKFKLKFIKNCNKIIITNFVDNVVVAYLQTRSELYMVVSFFYVILKNIAPWKRLEHLSKHTKSEASQSHGKSKAMYISSYIYVMYSY